MSKVLIVASGKSATQIHDFPYKSEGWTIVVVNHAWRLTQAYDYWVYPNDFKGEIDLNAGDRKIGHAQYQPALVALGGERECGHSITLAASYWALHKLRPSQIAFLGADMDYTPDENGHTAFYGVGLDVQDEGEGRNCIPDPMLMLLRYKEEDEEGIVGDDYLQVLYSRLETEANKRGCQIFNFSRNPTTLLPYRRWHAETLAR